MLTGMNLVFTLLFTAAFGFAAATGHMAGFTSGLFDGVKAAVDLAIGLTGVLALWLGLVKILEEAGAVTAIARFIAPVMRLIFPGLPEDHPALAAMTFNIAANMLGLGNAATPLGLKAMEELQKLNPFGDAASDAQATFLAINTGSVTLVPATVIALRASAHATAPADILLPGLVASFTATLAAIITARLLARLPYFRRPPNPPAQPAGAAP